MTTSIAKREELLVMLSSRIGMVAGGMLDIGSFKNWFTSLEWERLMADDSAALRLGWDIENILYQHDYDPEDVPERVVKEELQDILAPFRRSVIRRNTFDRVV